MPKLYSRISLLSIAFFIMSCNSQPTEQQATDQESVADTALSCMEQVIALDDSLGTVRNHACEKISLSQTIQEYVRGLEKADFGECPAAFTTAFKGHLEAWTQMIPVTDHYPELRGEMHDLFDIMAAGEHQLEFEPRLAAIWDTWSEVEEAIEE